jgi:ribosomal RNA-processing protein 36
MLKSVCRPQEVTSKRPVTRHRQVVEVPKIQARDPRFQTLSGNLDEQRFASQYGFLSDLRSSEHKELRENLKRARKRLTSSPQDTREERQEEVNRLEQALKRAESDVNRDKREKVEREALEKMKKEEREKRQQGKGAWYMRDGKSIETLSMQTIV